MKSKKVLLLLEAVIDQVKPKNHMQVRTEERVESLKDISFPEITTTEIDGVPLQEIKKAVIENIKKTVLENINTLKTLTSSLSPNGYYTCNVGKVSFKLDGKKTPGTLIVDFFNQGMQYVAIVNQRKLTTVILYGENYTPVDNLKHLERLLKKKLLPTDQETINLPGDTNLININLNSIANIIKANKGEGFKAEEVTKDNLPYKIRTDYRKDSQFVSEKFGTGKTINTSSGVKGDPGLSGKLDWVDVDFGKQYLSNGKLTSIRRIPNVYTTRYFENKMNLN